MARELRGRKLKAVSLLVPRSMSKILILTVQNNSWKCGEGKKKDTGVGFPLQQLPVVY